MRFHLGSIPDEFTPDTSWRAIREPDPIMAQFLSSFVGIGVAILVCYCWHHIGVPISLNPFKGLPKLLGLLLLLSSVPTLIVVHELLHVIIHPGSGRSSASVLGVWPSRLVFYAHYSGPMSRNRFLTILATPFLIITILPLCAAAMGLLSPTLAISGAWFSTLNALAACVDYCGIVVIWTQVPQNAIVQNQTWRTYWKSNVE